MNRLRPGDREKYEANLKEIVEFEQEIKSKQEKYKNNAEKLKKYCDPIQEGINDLEKENQSLLNVIVSSYFISTLISNDSLIISRKRDVIE